MFKKLVSNLPFNPSLLGELAFYYGRLKKEDQMRRLGFIMIVLSMFVQLFAVISPPEASLATSDNDVLRGGFSSKSEAVGYCVSDKQGFKDVLAYYGISCSHLEKTAVKKSIKSTDHNKQLDSMGRESRGSVITRTGKPTDEYPVRIGGTVFYLRNLWSFDTYSHSTYDVLEVKNAQNQTIYILYDCGNIVTVGNYTPPPPPPVPPVKPPTTPTPTPTPQPEPEQPIDVCTETPGPQSSFSQCDVCDNIPGTQTSSIECYPCPEAQNDSSNEACLELNKTASNLTQNIDDANNTMAHAGDTIVYTLHVKNIGTKDLPYFRFEEDLTDVLQYSDIVSSDGATIDEYDKLTWPTQTIPAGETVHKNIKVKVKNPIPNAPISTSDSTSNDLVMNNTFYGHSVNISIPKSVTKTIEIATKELPQTGPGESMLAIIVVTMIAGYFMSRTHLLRKETQLVRLEHANNGMDV